MIDDNMIRLNQQKIESYKQNIIQEDCIEIEGKEYIVPILEDNTSEIVMFHKPLWFVVSKNDPHNKTIYEILPEKFKNWWYIGRLDKNSSWLLLLTNDSKLVNEYEHPKFWIEKEYIVQLTTPLSPQEIKCIEQGIREEWDMLSVVSIRSEKKWTAKYRIVLNQWKKRHIRRIFKVLWNKVMTLQRIREGKYSLWDIKVGEWKEIPL